ncbi:acetoacetyl-CoA synthetase [Coniophora puteana RWD-64-598 SS2]|uniref:Acetoacetyl-CoA synthetase n=1 Tax=Coniophora puteana (strain RWD-64-598) TaxID=741705 RepID=A0A5M3MAH8_CONPW|nr:acetoacetyl-CoA synthetase [Coniophora puteana RWD-64-598 SS2]EIW76117.1 acetoacetyl-CoA synthetase [Coniophora puteana RWD-64-598 SS2]
MAANGDRPLWAPSSEDIQTSAVTSFLVAVNEKYHLSLAAYHDLYAWSTTHLDKFWDLVWDQADVIGVKGQHIVDNWAAPASNPPWFRDAKVNWAENLLWCRSREKIALIQATESIISSPPSPLRRVSYAELYDLVANIASALLSLGLKPGDRVAAYASNCIENVAACLAATAIGCIWVSAAADFGAHGVLERFEQVQPRVIVVVDAVVYNGKVHLHLPKVAALLDGLRQKSSVEPKVVVVHTGLSTSSLGWQEEWMKWTDFVVTGKESRLGRTTAGEIAWCRKGFDWPLWILFSSGTTGRPKPIVHRAGGMLLQAKKELGICANMKEDDVFFYYTTTGWMMWNFLVAGLSIGCTLVLYDGSPLREPEYLWNLVDELGISIFGTSAKYLDGLSKVYKPCEHHRLSTLRHIYSTGSPLAPGLFDYVYSSISNNVLLASITGGTDICSLFAGMCTTLPVYRGEIQCRMLGMAINTYMPTGAPSAANEAGELVCERPFPCMPIGFWPLAGFGEEEAVRAASTRYQASYFSEFKDIWYHGDHVLITQPRAGNGGGLVMLGRSDGVLNPGGIRFGSAEIYDILETCFSDAAKESSDHIEDSLVVGQSIDHGMDERVILFVKIAHGRTLSLELENEIKTEIRSRRSPRHTPAQIIQVDDIPYTLNGKRVEVPVKKIINGAPISSVNPATLRNPECLVAYAEIGKILRSVP